MCQMGCAQEVPTQSAESAESTSSAEAPHPLGFFRASGGCASTAGSPPLKPRQTRNISTESDRDALGLNPFARSNIRPERARRSGYTSPSKTFITQ